MRERTLSVLVVVFGALLLLFGVLEWTGSDGSARAPHGGETPSLPQTQLVRARPSPAEPVGPRVAPASPIPEHEEQIPAVFFGDVVIAGRVVDVTGNPVPDLALACRPTMFGWNELSARELHRTQTDADGAFEIKQLPRTYQYELRALGKGVFGSLQVWREPSQARLEVTLRVGRIRYVRLACVNERGAPVETVGSTVMEVEPASNRLVWTSTAPNARPAFMDLDPFRGSDPALESHTITVCFWEHESGEPLSLSVGVPNHEQVRVELEGRPLAEWPEATRLELRTQPLPSTQTLYRVVFPHAEGELPLVDAYLLRKPNSDMIRIVSWRKPGIVDEAGVRWELELPHMIRGRLRIPYETRVEGQTTWIVPARGSFGFATVHYDPKLRDRPDAYAVIYLLQPRAIQPCPLYPGKVRIGPLPRGPVRLRRVFFASPGQELARDEYSFDLNAEDVQVHWP